MATNKTIRTVGFSSALLLLVLGSPGSISGRCVPSPDLSARVLEFEVLQVSPLEGLLRFGREHDLCFGVEYFNEYLLKGKSDFTIRNTTVKGAIETILGPGAPVKIEVRDGVIEIVPRVPTNEKSVLDSVVPDWQAQRGPLTLVSWLLHVTVASRFDPQTKGFAGRSSGADVQDEVGPFNETNQPVKRLLDKIVANSAGAAWISQIPPGTTGIPRLREGRRIWAIVEYGDQKTDFAGAVNALLAQMP